MKVQTPTDVLVPLAAVESRPDLEAAFLAHYPRIARTLARIVRDRARAEELAVEVFLKWSRRGPAGDGATIAWLLTTAVRTGLDELRQQARRDRYERILSTFGRSPATPEELHAAGEQQLRVRRVLASLRRRDAELLVLRSQDLQYDELASMLRLNPSSVGTLLNRAQQRFKKEYESRYGRQ